jgi:hypothetical protein
VRKCKKRIDLTEPDTLKNLKQHRDKCENCGTTKDVFYSNLLSMSLCDKCEDYLCPF